MLKAVTPFSCRVLIFIKLQRVNSTRREIRIMILLNQHRYFQNFYSRSLTNYLFLVKKKQIINAKDLLQYKYSSAIYRRHVKKIVSSTEMLFLNFEQRLITMINYFTDFAFSLKFCFYVKLHKYRKMLNGILRY